jgi:hypothetical protein
MPLSRLSLHFSAVALLSMFAACNKTPPRWVSFKYLTDGAEVESPFTVHMQAENLVVEPATSGVTDGHGHFHIIVNSPMPPPTGPIPVDPQHIHYGQGQTEATLDLPEGEHTLLLQFAKGDHVPYDPQIVQQMRVTVTKRNAPAMDSAAADTAKADSAAPGE